MSKQDIIEKLELVWGSISELCETLSERDWSLPTDCPGWTVKDQISHMAGTESSLLGRPRPDHTPQDVSHTKNERGERNEVVVDWRRSWPVSKVLDDFREVTTERLKVLKAMSEDDFDAPSDTPIGPGKVSDALNIRILDCWVHEQDIRRAVGRPGHLEGPAAEHSVGRIASGMPYVVARKVQAPDGTTVAIEITGKAGRILPITMNGSRANLLEEAAPEKANTHLKMDVEAFMRLGCGRWEPASALDNGRVQIHGDESLGKAILSQMNIMI